MAFVVLIAPVTAWLAGWERGARAASPGKRLLRLRVATAITGTGGTPTTGNRGRAPGNAATTVVTGRAALVRNALKVALPWELGHTAAYLLADPDAGAAAVRLGSACGVLASAIPLAYLATLFVGVGRTPYDRLAGTVVTRPPSGPAPDAPAGDPRVRPSPSDAGGRPRTTPTPR